MTDKVNQLAENVNLLPVPKQLTKKVRQLPEMVSQLTKKVRQLPEMVSQLTAKVRHLPEMVTCQLGHLRSMD